MVARRTLTFGSCISVSSSADSTSLARADRADPSSSPLSGGRSRTAAASATAKPFREAHAFRCASQRSRRTDGQPADVRRLGHAESYGRLPSPIRGLPRPRGLARTRPLVPTMLRRVTGSGARRHQRRRRTAHASGRNRARARRRAERRQVASNSSASARSTSSGKSLLSFRVP